MSSDFLEVYGKLPRRQQTSVRTLIDKFNSHAKLSGLNYERIKQAADPNMRSLRIDGDYRAIVLKPERGSVHLLLWVDKHDPAYDWAERHHCRVNAETGAIQVYQPRIVEAVEQPQAEGDAAGEGAFEGLKDRQLTRLGVPEAMLAEVREIGDEAQLDAMESRLPRDAYESLFFYLAGTDYDQLVLDREPPPAPVDAEDFAKALENVETRARFVVVENQEELEAMLNAPLERWRVFLHPSQRRLVERSWSGPVRVLGGAGTGKTVVAMHRARYLARRLLAEQRERRAAGESAGSEGRQRPRILFTTFTRNLAADIENNLRFICSEEEMALIEVTNLDSWLVGFLKRRRYDFQVIFGRSRNAWAKALEGRPEEPDLPKAFYEAEWEQVVQANGVESREQYLRVPRTGRGTRLSRSGRSAVWGVFAQYRAQLAERSAREAQDAARDAAAMLAEDRDDLDYVSLIVDEAQDIGAQYWQLLRAMVPKGPDDLFLVGDGHQRIYGQRRVVLRSCGVDIRGRSKKLRLNYRTTEETRRWAARLLESRTIDDLDGGSDDDRGVTSLMHGPAPAHTHFDGREEHDAFIVDFLADLPPEEHRSVCVAARTAAELERISEALDDIDLPFAVIEGADEATEDGVRLATMHRVKGLEFDRVVIASVNRSLVPLAVAVKGKDEAETEAAETAERSLLYVAATRAKKELKVLSYGKPSRFLEEA